MRVLRFSLLGLAVALTAISLTTIQGQGPGRVEGTTIKGRVVRVNPSNGSFIVRNSVGKEVTVYGGPRTTYRLGDRDIRIGDVREGMTLSGTYNVTDDRYILGSATFAAEGAAQEEKVAPPPRETSDAARLHGRIIRAESDPNHLVFRTADGKEMLLYLDNKMEVTATFEMRGGKRVLVGLNAGAAREEGRPVDRDQTARPAEDTRISGTVVRVLGTDNQFIVRTSEGKEMTFYGDPSATYTFDERTVKFADIPQGASVDINYSMRGTRPYANRVIGRRRR